jgi:SAM-dependent methyltransferase
MTDNAGGMPMRVNIGCGTTPTEGWLNLDNSLTVRLARRPVLLSGLQAAGLLSRQSLGLAVAARQENIRYADAVRRIPCPDGSAEAVYSAHMIEHLDRGEARRFLGEARRVLAPGGVLRLAVPDLWLLVHDYLSTRDADDFVLRTYLAWPRPAGLAARARAAVAGPRHHLWMYDGPSLIRLLCRTGFADVAVAPPGETRITDPGSLDLKERLDESIYVEAVRPRGPRA